MTLVLDALAVLCFVLAAFGVSGGRVNLTAAGLALWASTSLVVLLP